ncbi:family 43 glycosylhydrolase [Parabacteroides sp. FAFU027]|uniref:family 43 glycosylhydrolase n=1 Tax=Parabacteroides sp. FAFU027 TaxID=2922715 RepID=UPI001FAF510F|nr:family 43 glycosylhydrolase [Parabacteroides sp. FAFU027]
MKKILILALGILCLASAPFAQTKKAKTGIDLNEFLVNGEPKLPDFKPFMDQRIRDPFIMAGPDKTYYMTGTLPYNHGDSTYNEGIPLWRSKDLKNWEDMGVIWTFEKDGAWQKQWTAKNGNARRALWAPEIHYINKNWYLVYTVTGLGMGIMKSTSGRPEGPYKGVTIPDGPIVNKGIDASLFQDDDGKVFFLWGDGMIAPMNKDLTSFAEKPTKIIPSVIDTVREHHYVQHSCKELDHVGFEAAFMFKKDGRYYLSCADRYHGYYHNMTVESTNIKGPYSARYVSVPFCGHGSLFQDFNGQYWWTYFGNDKVAPFSKPAIVSVEFNKEGHLQPKQ